MKPRPGPALLQEKRKEHSEYERSGTFIEHRRTLVHPDRAIEVAAMAKTLIPRSTARSKWSLLGRSDLCRTKLLQTNFLVLKTSYIKLSNNFPNFCGPSLAGQIISQNIPAKFPPKLPAISRKISPTSFSAGWARTSDCD